MDRNRTFVLLSLATALGLAGVGVAAQRSWIHPKCQHLPADHMGPFVTLADGNVLAVSAIEALVSKDDGKTWEGTPLFADPQKFEARPERALIRTSNGVIVMVLLNQKEIHPGKWETNNRKALAEYFLPTYVTRSLDDGKTWETPQKIQDGWCGAIRSLIQLKSGRLVLAGQNLAFDPGRHVVMSYISDDDGKTWRRSNIIDLGGAGDHGGAMEGTVVELSDGRVLMLIRTVWGRFWEAFSDDGGQSWRVIRPSDIGASSSPGILATLQSGRRILLWNRFVDPVKRTGRREELSMSFTSDDGKTWTTPVVIARDPGKRQSYPYVYERSTGELWITTMQGMVRLKLNEADFTTKKNGS